MKISGKNLFQLQRAYLLVKTSRIQETSKFYSILNRLGTPSNLEPSRLLGNRLAIVSSEKSDAGFLFAGNDLDFSNEIQDPDKRPIYFSSEESLPQFSFVELAPSFIPILRSSFLEKTKDFYARYAMCQEEQHAKGPKHYSLNWKGPFTEIYPQRKNQSATVEFLLQTPDLSFVLGGMKENNFKIISQNNSQALVEDPNGFWIRIMQN